MISTPLPSISDLPVTNFQTEILLTTVVSLEKPLDEHNELGLMLAAIESFRRAENLSFVEAETKSLLTHNWSNELEIINWALLYSSTLASRLAFKSKHLANQIAPADLSELSMALGEAYALGEQLAASGKTDFTHWKNFTQTLSRSLNTAAFVNLSGRHLSNEEICLPSKLRQLPQHQMLRQPFGREMLFVFSSLTKLLERLKFVREKFSRDEPLKPTLPVFALVNQEAKALLDFINNRVLRFLPPEHQFFDLLDGTGYILSMELRKVFQRELTGVTAMRSAQVIRARIEAAHGLLQDCFQQSIVALAQLFQPELTGADVFSSYTDRLEQSLVLRRDLWVLLQIVQKLETAPDNQQLNRLSEKLAEFRQNSLWLLMFKDIETTERFVEEVLYTRRSADMGHLLNRFAAYLETLLGQVNMRTVLSDHPFDYSAVQE